MDKKEIGNTLLASGGIVAVIGFASVFTGIPMVNRDTAFITSSVVMALGCGVSAAGGIVLLV